MNTRQTIALLCSLVTVALAQQYNNNNCNPGICGSIPGLVFNADLGQCAWPDEIGCSLRDLGYSSTCDVQAYDLKPADFAVALPEGRRQEQYFVVCVPETTLQDRALQHQQISGVSPRGIQPQLLPTRGVVPTGQVAPRLVGCPGDQVFNPETKICE